MNRYGKAALFMQSGPPNSTMSERPAAAIYRYKRALQEVEEKAETEGGGRGAEHQVCVLYNFCPKHFSF